MTSLTSKTINNSLTRSNSNEIIEWGIPDYSAGISVSKDDILNGYTAPEDGFLFTTLGWTTLKVNNNSLPNGDFYTPFDARTMQQIFIPVKKGDVILGTDGYLNGSNIFFPASGV